MNSMFYMAIFNQDISTWDVSNVTNCNLFSYNFPNNSNLSQQNTPEFLIDCGY